MAGKKAIQIVNYAALGGGSIAGGFLERVVPVANPMVKSGVVIAAGILLSTMKQEPVKFAGYGMIARGASGLASGFGIGEEMLADAVTGGGSDIEDELADELAAAMEEELADEANDGTY